MDELKINYNIVSKKHQTQNDRIQILIASFVLTVGFIELFESFTGVLVLIPILAFIISLINIFIVLKYNWFDEKYGLVFEANIFRINGIIILITALSIQFVGDHTVQYVYYVLAVFYLFFLPAIATKVRSKMMLIFLSEKIIAIRLISKPKEYIWKNIDTIIRNGELLRIKEKKTRKKKKYFLMFNDQGMQFKLDHFLKNKQKEYNFSLEIL